MNRAAVGLATTKPALTERDTVEHDALRAAPDLRTDAEPCDGLTHGHADPA